MANYLISIADLISDPHSQHKFHRMDFNGVAQSVFVPRIIKELKQRGLNASRIGKHLLEKPHLSTTTVHAGQENAQRFTARKGSRVTTSVHLQINRREKCVQKRRHTSCFRVLENVTQ